MVSLFVLYCINQFKRKTMIDENYISDENNKWEFQKFDSKHTPISGCIPCGISLKNDGDLVIEGGGEELIFYWTDSPQISDRREFENGRKGFSATGNPGLLKIYEVDQ